jgi:GT2 family glycosyltransferase
MTETLSIGLVTFNHEQVIEKTLRSVLDSLSPAIPAHVWVLDNCSADGTLSVLHQAAAGDSRVTVIANTRNEGFARGNNRILRLVNSTYHVFCNPDITITRGALDTLLRFLRSHPDVGIVCPRVHFNDGRLQPLNKRHPTVSDLFLRRFMPAAFQRYFAERMRRYDMLDRGYDESYDVPFVSGAFMVCRTQILQALGGFDVRFFLYLEDADLSRRVQQSGWRTVYCPDAVVLHEWRRDAHRSYRGTLLFCASVFRYFNKWGWRLTSVAED